eukprot:TRINITY_DN1429_c0_g1_i1.p1 TRINITY_DN1429_c0_g1~~TRINITY_DN1429_c0_g1_i1.p1  ORF type:complete len:663 (+),score=162.64 TRINITY_DN1429_c0_g1_i1:59-2047(+)
MKLLSYLTFIMAYGLIYLIGICVAIARIKFFQNLDDFIINPSNLNGLTNEYGNVVKIAHITDLHVSKSNPNFFENFHKFSTDIVQHLSPDAIIATGDLTNSVCDFVSLQREYEWQLYNETVFKYLKKYNYFDIRGNHDSYSVDNFENPLQNKFLEYGYVEQTMKQYIYKDLAYKIEFNDLNIVLFDTNELEGPKWPLGFFGSLNNNRTQILDSLLEKNDSKINLIFTHHPRHTLYPSSVDRFEELLKKNKVAYHFNGHAHASEMTMRFDSLTEIETNSIGHFGVYRMIISDNGIITSRTFNFNKKKEGFPLIIPTVPKDKTQMSDYEYYDRLLNATHFRCVVLGNGTVDEVILKVLNYSFTMVRSGNENSTLWVYPINDDVLTHLKQGNIRLTYIAKQANGENSTYSLESSFTSTPNRVNLSVGRVIFQSLNFGLMLNICIIFGSILTVITAFSGVLIVKMLYWGRNKEKLLPKSVFVGFFSWGIIFTLGFVCFGKIFENSWGFIFSWGIIPLHEQILSDITNALMGTLLQVGYFCPLCWSTYAKIIQKNVNGNNKNYKNRMSLFFADIGGAFFGIVIGLLILVPLGLGGLLLSPIPWFAIYVMFIRYKHLVSEMDPHAVQIRPIDDTILLDDDEKTLLDDVSDMYGISLFHEESNCVNREI